jgi:hypothetical protein
MKKPLLALAACLATAASAQAKNSIIIQGNQLVGAQAQLAHAAQRLIMINVMEKIDFAKDDNLQPSSAISCKTDYMPYGNPGYLSICTQELSSDRTTFKATARMITRGTKKGLAEQARFGTALPTEMEMKLNKGCLVPHLLVVNAQNNQPIVNEIAYKCDNYTIDVKFEN